MWWKTNHAVLCPPRKPNGTHWWKLDWIRFAAVLLAKFNPGGPKLSMWFTVQTFSVLIVPKSKYWLFTERLHPSDSGQSRVYVYGWVCLEPEPVPGAAQSRGDPRDCVLVSVEPHYLELLCSAVIFTARDWQTDWGPSGWIQFLCRTKGRSVWFCKSWNDVNWGAYLHEWKILQFLDVFAINASVLLNHRKIYSEPYRSTFLQIFIFGLHQSWINTHLCCTQLCKSPEAFMSSGKWVRTNEGSVTKAFAFQIRFETDMSDCRNLGASASFPQLVRWIGRFAHCQVSYRFVELKEICRTPC